MLSESSETFQLFSLTGFLSSILKAKLWKLHWIMVGMPRVGVFVLTTLRFVTILAAHFAISAGSSFGLSGLIFKWPLPTPLAFVWLLLFAISPSQFLSLGWFYLDPRDRRSLWISSRFLYWCSSKRCCNHPRCRICSFTDVHTDAGTDLDRVRRNFPAVLYVDISRSFSLW